MSKTRKWTAMELAFLRYFKSKELSNEEIARVLNRTCASIRNKASSLKISHPVGWHSKFNNPMKGKKHSEKTRLKQSKIAKERFKFPSNHPSWHGGRRETFAGYIEVHMPEHPHARKNGYVFEHILIAEKAIGRHLTSEEVVHHKNEIKTDNRPENLKVITKGEHSHIHAQPKTGEYLICPVCGKQFYVKPSHIEKRTTCSMKCAGALFSSYFTNKPRNYHVSKEEKEEFLCSTKLY